MLINIVVGALCGAVNGSASRCPLPPFIATLGMMLVARGIALQVTDARAVSGLGEAFGMLGNGALFASSGLTSRASGRGLPRHPHPVILMLLAGWLLCRTTPGATQRRGLQPEAARLGRQRQPRVMFAITSPRALAGLTGCVLMSRLVTAQPNEGVMYELDAIAAAVIGGTSRSGGVGTVSAR